MTGIVTVSPGNRTAVRTGRTGISRDLGEAGGSGYFALIIIILAVLQYLSAVPPKPEAGTERNTTLAAERGKIPGTTYVAQEFHGNLTRVQAGFSSRLELPGQQ